MTKKMLATVFALAVTVGVGTVMLNAAPAHAITAFDINDNNNDEYLDTRTVEVGQGSGQIDFSTYPEVQPPEFLELVLTNSAANPVNVRIPELNLSFLVPAQSERVHYVASTALGDHYKVDFTSEEIVTAQAKAMDLSSIQHILAASYVTPYVPPEDEEPVTHGGGHSSNGSNVRGYW